MMKNILLLPMLLLVLFSSCKKDDDCVPGSLSTVIVGEWDTDYGNVEFHANGTYTDPDEALVFNTIGATEVEEFTYVVDSNTRLRIRADIGTDIIDYIVQVHDFSCDKINLEITGLDYTLERD